MKNYKMVIAYDGRRYKGFRKTKQDEEKSIQGKLEAILFKRYNAEIEVISAVNTDAGVNAKNQVVNFKVPDTKPDTKGIFNYFEEFLPDDIIVKSVVTVDDKFHSRYLVKNLTYQYRLWKVDAKNRPLFERHYVNVMKKPMNIPDMQDGAKKFLGEHDFGVFSTNSKVKNPIKTINAISVVESGNEVIITITANGFLLNMERIIVGTLIQIGFGEKKIGAIDHTFKTRKTELVGHKAMAHALCLESVEY